MHKALGWAVTPFAAGVFQLDHLHRWLGVDGGELTNL